MASESSSQEYFRRHYGWTRSGSYDEKLSDGYRENYQKVASLVKGDHVSDYSYTTSGGRLMSFKPNIHYERSAEGWQHTVIGESTTESTPDWSDALRWNPGAIPGADNASAESLTRALNGLVPNSRKMELGAAIGEGKDTVEMFLKTASNVVGALNSLKRGNVLLAAKHLGITPNGLVNGTSLANGWLQLQYGVRPLLSDLHSLQLKVHDEVLQQETLVRASATASASMSMTTGRYGGVTKVTGVSSTRTVLIGAVTSTVTRTIEEWGLLNPLSIAWELVPFSFVVDWVMPIGNTLSALSASGGLSFKGGFSNVRTKWTIENTGDSNSGSMYGGDYYYENRGGGFTTSQWFFNREPLHSFPLPKIYVTSPFLDKEGNLKTQRIASGLALLRNTF